MQVQCPSCNTILDTPDNRAGQVVNCPKCGGQMQLPAAGPNSAPPAIAPTSTPGLGLRPDTAPKDKPCPYCGEPILAVAAKCRHCNTMLSGPNTGKSSIPGRTNTSAKGEGKKALTLGIIGLVLFCIPIAGIILGSLAIKYGKSAKENPDEAGVANTAVILGYIAVALGILVILGNLMRLAGGV